MNVYFLFWVVKK